jgi:hypothetical protein
MRVAMLGATLAAAISSLMSVSALAQATKPVAPSSAAAPAYAVPPAGLKTFYSGPTKVNLAGRPVIADIALHADMNAAKAGDLKVALTTDVTKFVDETETDLKNYIKGRYNECGERWRSGDPFIGFPNNAIRFKLDLEVEFWQCGFDGKGKPGRLTQDGGTVDLTLIPYVENGRLQARLGDFSLVVSKGLGKYMPLESLVRRALEGELKKLNENPKFYRAPNPLFAEKFAYESMGAKVDADKRVIITARYKAKGEAKAFDRIAAKMKTEGVTQQQ